MTDRLIRAERGFGRAIALKMADGRALFISEVEATQLAAEIATLKGSKK